MDDQYNRYATDVKTNVFELRLRGRLNKWIPEPGAPELEELRFIPEIWIDGVHLDEPHTVSVNALVRSFNPSADDRYRREWVDVFACQCGNARCAHIHEGIGVLHAGPYVDWVFRRPQANPHGCRFDGLDKWLATATWHHLRFRRNQVRTSLVDFFQKVEDLRDTTSCYLEDENLVESWFRDDPRLDYLPYRLNAITRIVTGRK